MAARRPSWKSIFSSPEPKAHGELLWSLTIRRCLRRRCRCSCRRRPDVRLSTILTSPPKQLVEICPNFTGMILGWSSFKVVQMVLVHCISRSQELKIDFLTKNLKNLLVRNHWTYFHIILQKCSFCDPLPRLFKPFGFVKKHGRQGAGLIFPIYLYRKL